MHNKVTQLAEPSQQRKCPIRTRISGVKRDRMTFMDSSIIRPMTPTKNPRAHMVYLALAQRRNSAGSFGRVGPPRTTADRQQRWRRHIDTVHGGCRDR